MFPLSRSVRVTSIVLCFCVGMFEGWDIQALGVAAPVLRTTFGLSAGDLGSLFFVSNLGLAIGASLGGRLADLAGRKRVFAAAVALFGAFTWATAGATGFATFAAARLLAGFGLGAGLANMIAIAADLSEPRHRTRVTTWMFCGVPLGGAALALLAQSLPLARYWGTLFLIGGAAPLALSVAIMALIPDLRRPAPDGSRAIPVAETLFGAGRARSTLLLWLAFLPTMAALYLMLYWLPILVGSKALSPTVATRSVLAFNLAGMAGALAFGWLADRGSPQVVLACGHVALVLAGLALATASTPLPVLALSAVAGFALLGATYALYGLASIIYPSRAAATGVGVAIGVGRVGSMLGPLLPGLLAESGSVFLWVAGAAGFAAAALLLLRLPPRTAPGKAAAAS